MSNDGGAAFPMAVPEVDYGTGRVEYGMTLRDYFAAKAMAPMVAAAVSLYVDSPERPQNFDRELAEAAYIVADAMLKARSK